MKIFENVRQNQLLINLICFLAGLITALSMPGYNMSFLAWIGFVPLILFIKNCSSVRKSLSYGFFFGLGFNLLGLNWLLGLHPLGWLGFSNIESLSLVSVIWLYIATYCAIFIAVFALLTYYTDRLNSLLAVFLIPIIWSIAVNKLMTLGEFGFPWLMIEYSQYKNLFLLQYAQFLGGIGIGFLIILINTAIAFILNDFIHGRINLKFSLIKISAVVSGIIVLHFCGYLLVTQPVKTTKTITATIIQSNITVEKEKKSMISLKSIENSFLDEIKKAPSGLVVIPETAIFDFIRYQDSNFYNELDSIAKSRNKTLILGVLDIGLNKKGIPTPTNSALILDKANYRHNENIYNKVYLVPFGEYVPFSGFVPGILKKLASTAARADFLRGNKFTVIPTYYGNVAPSICYDITFP
ncbi:MAG: apolipoprotein N-acyltransferase, partial [Candidatus Gastranaerophilales bacterium]|nr:apolipoprotein N-acyltransferase [Candidatus Gastranaerophilales bacterium]